MAEAAGDAHGLHNALKAQLLQHIYGLERTWVRNCAHTGPDVERRKPRTIEKRMTADVCALDQQLSPVVTSIPRVSKFSG